MTEKENKIINLLREKDSPMTAKEVTAILNPGSYQSANFGYLDKMNKKGIVKKEWNKFINAYEFSLIDEEISIQIKNNIDKESIKYNREEGLKNNFNNFWSEFFNKEDDFYSKISFERLVKLKQAVSDINNIVTFKATIAVAEQINNILNINNKDAASIIKSIKETNSNSNGYDIEFTGKHSYIAEIKCNIPINGGDKFGVAQLNGIIKDINGLLNMKTKSSIKDIGHYYKFLGIYDFDDNTKKAVYSMLNKLPDDLRDYVKLYNKDSILNKDNVYILFIKIQK